MACQNSDCRQQMRHYTVSSKEMTFSTELPTLSWQQLLLKLESLIESEGARAADVHHATIKALLTEYKSEEADFESFVSFDEGGYTKNLVKDFGLKCNVIVMCWAAGQASAFHGHEGSKCFVKVLSGLLVEQQVPYPSESQKVQDSLDAHITDKKLKRDDVSYIDDCIGLHKVTNNSLRESAVTLHIYLPAYTKCRIFDSIDSTNHEGSDLGKTIDVILRRPNQSI